jgi:hypothetical protein
VVVSTFTVTLWSALNGDVTYAFGGIETAGRGGVSVWDVFVARPVAYRLLLGGLDAVRDVIAGDASVTVSHVVIRIETAVVVLAVTVVLFLGVRRFLGRGAAATVAAATGLALVISPPWHFLEPDWVAALAAALAVGAACAPRRVWAGALLGGFAAFLTVAVKLATAPIGLLALLMVALLSRRRAGWAALAAAGFTVAWYALTRFFLPWEGWWLRDQANLVRQSPIHHGIRWRDIEHLLDAIANVAVVSPVVVVAPAAVAVLIRRLPPGRPRWLAATSAVLAAGLSVASAYGQGEFFMYHFAVVPVLAAGVWGAAFHLCRPARVPLLVATVIAAGASVVLLRLPAQWRLQHLRPVEAALLLAAAAAAAVVWVAARRTDEPRSGRWTWAVCSVAMCAALLPANLHGSAYSFSIYNYAVPNRAPLTSGYDELSARIGRDTPVLYLTFGSVNFVMGNPTTCRYPSPQWLQRGARLERVRTYRSHADNLRCLTDDRTARYLVWHPGWFLLERAGPDVQALIASRFDCSPAARVPAPPALVVCPARPGS